MAARGLVGTLIADWCSEAWNDGLRSWSDIDGYIQAKIACLPEPERTRFQLEMTMAAFSGPAIHSDEVTH